MISPFVDMCAGEGRLYQVHVGGKGLAVYGTMNVSNDFELRVRI